MATKKQEKVTPVVTVAELGNVRSVNFTAGMNLGSALEAAGIVVGSGNQIRINTEVVTKMTTKLKAGDQILIAGEIRGA